VHYAVGRPKTVSRGRSSGEEQIIVAPKDAYRKHRGCHSYMNSSVSTRFARPFAVALVAVGLLAAADVLGGEAALPPTPALGAPAEVAPGVIRFAPAATAPDRGANGSERVWPLGPGIGRTPANRTATLAALSPADLARLQQEDATRASARDHKRLRVGIERRLAEPLLVNAQTAGTEWTEAAGGWRVWSARLTSSGASGLRIHLDNVQLPPGARLLVYDPAHPAAEAAVTAETLRGQRDVWMESVFAETVILECQVPPEVEPATVAFSVASVSHFYRPLLGGFVQKTLGCEQDVACYPAWATTASGIARMYFVDTGSTYLCTGCLLNTTPSSFVAYFLTANHCIGNQTVASTLELYWLDQTSMCNGSPPMLSNLPHTTGGADYLAGSSGNDFTFLRLHQNPPNSAAYLGWSTASPATGESLAGLHHPGQPTNDYTRICFGNTSSSDANFWTIQWNTGTTEEGSSGSPLLNSGQQVIGQLYGGNLACPPDASDDYGRFNVTYQAIHQWLEPVPPANDTCAGAIALTNNVYYSQQTDSATDDSAPCSGTISKGVWFTFTPTVLGTATVDTYPSDFDTQLEVLSGNCGALKSVGCRYYSANAFHFTCLPGTTYHICVGGLYGDSATSKSGLRR
jgi:hypothetical protein